MKAFTHLFQKTIFSVMDDTLTIYEKPNYPELSNIINKMDDNRFGITHYFNGFESIHSTLHQDGMDRSLTHFHAHFKETLSLNNLMPLLNYLAYHNILTYTEINQFISDFKQANELSSVNQQVLISSVKPVNLLFNAPKPSDAVTFEGLKSGFLNKNPTMKSTNDNIVLVEKKEPSTAINTNSDSNNSGLIKGFFNQKPKQTTNSIVTAPKTGPLVDNKTSNSNMSGFKKGFFNNPNPSTSNVQPKPKSKAAQITSDANFGGLKKGFLQL